MANLSEDDLAEIREIFSHFDRDSSGSIDIAEFDALLRALDAQVNDEETKTGLEALDANKNGKIDFDEFVEWWSDR